MKRNYQRPFFIEVFLWSLIALAGLILQGCAEDNILTKRRLIYCSDTSPDTFNPQLSATTSTLQNISLQLYDRLFEFNPDTLRLEGALARDWFYDESTLTYTIELKEDIYFHHTKWFTPTRPFNSADVAFTFERLTKTNHPYHFVSSDGEYPLLASLDFVELIRNIKTPSPYKIVFELTRPNSSFLASLASHYAVILSEEYGQILLKEGQPEYIDTLPVGTGPFFLLDFKQDDFIRYQRNPLYWRDNLILEQVIFDITPKVTTRLAKLVTGECDIMSYPSASQIPAIKNNDNLELITQESMNTAYVAFNTHKTPLNNKRVRQAIAMAIDKEKILQIVYFNEGNTADSILPPISWAYHFNIDTHPYNPQKARAILEEIDPEFDYSLSLWVEPGAFPYNPDTLKTAQLIQVDLNRIGIHVEIKQYPWQVIQPLLTVGQHDMLLFGWSEDNTDPDSSLQQLLSCSAVRGGYNFSRWCSRTTDLALQNALLSSEWSERMQQYRAIQDTIYEEVPLVPLIHAPHLLAHRKNIRGLSVSPFGDIGFYRVMEK